MRRFRLLTQKGYSDEHYINGIYNEDFMRHNGVC